MTWAWATWGGVGVGEGGMSVEVGVPIEVCTGAPALAGGVDELDTLSANGGGVIIPVGVCLPAKAALVVVGTFSTIGVVPTWLPSEPDRNRPKPATTATPRASRARIRATRSIGFVGLRRLQAGLPMAEQGFCGRRAARACAAAQAFGSLRRVADRLAQPFPGPDRRAFGR